MTYTLDKQDWSFQWPKPPKPPLTWVQMMWIFLNPFLFFATSMFDGFLKEPIQFVVSVLGIVLW
ncbi:MAG: hypothetical protein ACRCXZ_09250 [Patescibacteria group bacterium]